jgi:hypothetical protein
VGGWGQIVGFLRKERSRLLIASTVGLAFLFFGAIFYLRQAAISGSPETYLYLEVAGTLVSFCYAANALVRFRGTHDRTALILAFGFVLSGIIETVGYFGLNDVLQAGPVALTRIPMGWMVGRTILAVFLLSAIAVERYIPNARQPSKETAGALLVVAIATYLTSAAFLAAPSAPLAHAASLVSRPWDLLPGALFLFAAICFGQRLQSSKNNKTAASLYDYSLFVVASLNVVCHVSAAFSRHLFDGPFFLAEISKTASYVVMLSGALLDQARLFDQVRSMAVSDSLTGLANYRRLISVLSASCFSIWTASKASTITTAISPGAAPSSAFPRFFAAIPAPSIPRHAMGATNSLLYFPKPVRTSPDASFPAFANASPPKPSRLHFLSAPGLQRFLKTATRRKSSWALPTARSMA